MKKMFFIGCLLCLAAVCRAQYIGSDYLNMKFDYVVDESQMQGTVGYGKVFIHWYESSVGRCRSVHRLRWQDTGP